MRPLAYAATFILVLLVAVFTMMPLSFLMERAKSTIPALHYVSASGTVWDGNVNALSYGVQPLGNLKLTTQAAALLTGKWAGNVRLAGGGITAMGAGSASLGGDLALSDVRISGRTSDLLSLRPEIRALDGEFLVSLEKLKMKSNACKEATGTVWTDILVRLEGQYDWRGPELRGPVSCDNGSLLIMMDGTGSEGERVALELRMNANATGRFEARIENASDQVAQAASLLGFVTDGNLLVYQHSLQ